MTQKKFLKVDGTNNMTGNLNLNEKTIINLNTDDKDIKSAANVGYVSSKVHTAKGDVTVGLKTYLTQKSRSLTSPAQPIRKTFSGISWKMLMNLQVKTT